MSRARIEEIVGDKPTVVWHRSFHELYMNAAAMEMVGVVAAEIKPGMQIDIERGWFFEGGLGYAINRLNPWILAPEKYAAGLQRLKQVVHHGGHTTIGDLATGMFNFSAEAEALSQHLEGDDVPFRTRLVAHGTVLTRAVCRPSKALSWLRRYCSAIAIVCTLAGISNCLAMAHFSVSSLSYKSRAT